MLFKFSMSIFMFLAFTVQFSEAAPSVAVSPLGPTPSGNRLWIFQVIPDFSLAPPSGTPLAVELAFAIDHTDLVDVDVNTGVWDTELPGNNPFTGSVTEGLWIDLIGDRTFGAFGSLNVTTPGAVDLFLIETAGLGLTTLRYGVAASGHPSRGARIAQLTGETTSANFDGHTGTITVPEPTCLLTSIVGVVTFAVILRRRREIRPNNSR